MNERFIAAVKKSGMTLYRLSKETGIPYTNLSELANQKKAINDRPIVMIRKIAFALNINMEGLMDQASVMDGVTGKYKSIRYKCEFNGEEVLIYLQDKTQMTIRHTGILMDGTETKEDYVLIIEMMIERYLREKEMHERFLRYAEELT